MTRLFTAKTLLAAFVATFCFATPANASVPLCKTFAGTPIRPGLPESERDFYINVSEHLPVGLTPAMAEAAILKGVKMWEDSVGIKFTYLGRTTKNPSPFGLINRGGVDNVIGFLPRYGIVTQTAIARGQAYYNYSAPNVDERTPYKWDIWLETNFPFSTGSPQSGKMSLETIVAHELGHVLGLDHTTDSTDLMAAAIPFNTYRKPSAVNVAMLKSIYNGDPCRTGAKNQHQLQSDQRGG